MNAKDHLVGANDLPPGRSRENTGVVSGAPTENPRLHLPAEPAMDAVLTPYHGGMVPAWGPKESTSKAEYDPTENRFLPDRIFTRGEQPRAIRRIPGDMPTP